MRNIVRALLLVGSLVLVTACATDSRTDRGDRPVPGSENDRRMDQINSPRSTTEQR